MKNRNRFLSAFLAFCICLSLAAPALAAEPAGDPVGMEGQETTVPETPAEDAGASEQPAPEDEAEPEPEPEAAPLSSEVQPFSVSTVDGTYHVDSTYPEDLIVYAPLAAAPETVMLGTQTLDGALWTGVWNEGPSNAVNYPADMVGWKVTVDAETFQGISDGAHTLAVSTADDTYQFNLIAQANTHVAKSYYLSNSGSDSNTGLSEDQAWATFDKLSTVTFGPGDTIYLDATSVWSNVQFQPKGSGANGAPVTLTKYNDGGNSSKRPILNGDGTIADFTAHSYLAFDAWRKFYPSGTIELFNVEYWEVNGIEITNYTNVINHGATGRNGIAVIYDYFETQGITTMPATNQDKEEAFYHAGKLQHIVIEDCYIHDVAGYHPTNGAKGRGGKMSGGINAYGPYDDLKIEKNIVMYCDVEGIRNDVLAWMGDTDTQFPHYMEGVSISNNFIAGVPGDGVVISSAVSPRLANNYLTDAGYSYYATTNTNTNQFNDTFNFNDPNSYRDLITPTGTQIKAMGNRENPMTMGATNFAGLWFIGTLDAVCEYNESVNNVWVCVDGEAFDADMYCRGTVFQYNYTYRNNGGFALFMGKPDLPMYDGTIVRYNVSVEDGEGIGSPNGKKATFFYNGAPEAIYNNLFILGDKVTSMFGGRSNEVYFYNNMVIKPSGEIGDFHLNGDYSKDDVTHDFTSSSQIKNNLFYPAAIFDNITYADGAAVSGNITPDSLDGVFYDLDKFMESQPVKALNGRSTLTGTPVEMESGKGAGVVMSVADGRKVKAPNGTGFNYAQFEGIKTVENAPTIGAGTAVTFPYQSQAEQANPLKYDFFKNSIAGVTTPDIGPYQWSADPNHYVYLAFEGNGTEQVLETVLAKSGVARSLPKPVKVGFGFAGWYDNAELSGQPVNASSYVVPDAGVTLYAKWVTSDVTALADVNSTYPEDLSVYSPYPQETPAELSLDGVKLDSAQWSAVENEGPSNAKYYPADMTGWKVTVPASVLKGISDGAHELKLVMASGFVHTFAFNAAANTHVAKSYYLSNGGSDSNIGLSKDQAWATFDKLSTVTFGPGDTIYLDATSVWSNVQFQPKGSGANGAPITLTKYNDGGDPSKRPILNGDGTIADKDAHSYLAFDAWRWFYPSGTIELFNVEYWEVRGIEVTNYTDVMTQGATGRNGIAVIYDYFETQGITTMPATNQDKEEAFYHAGKLQHIVIEDCYVHDVVGYHPTNGAKGRGGKMSGGINAYGPYDDLKIEKNIVMYCDVEGIRNDVLAWMGDTDTQFPHYMEGVSISNNYIAGVPGDGVVISSAVSPRLANNYLTDAGYSYYATTNTNTNTNPNTNIGNKPVTDLTSPTGTQIKAMGNRENPMTMGATNFAGLWFIGTLDAACEYNESVNNVWVCADGEAFDADMYCRGTVFQYNYTYRNNGGFALFMGKPDLPMYDGTIVRYNVSVEDGEGIGSPNGKKATFFYNGAPEAIYNNLFILGENVTSMFGGRSDEVHFYNNMVIKPSGEIGDFHLNGDYSKDDVTSDFTSTSQIKNNLFYPAAIFDNITYADGADVSGNIATNNAAELPFYDLDAFMAAQPLHALNGRSAFTGAPVEMESGKGAGVAMSAAEGRNVKAPDGTGFNYAQFEGIKTVEGAITIGAGTAVTFPYQDQAELANPLTHDFFKNPLNGVTTPDIGPYQWSADPNHFVYLSYEGNGAQQALETELVKSGVAHALPQPTKAGYIFYGWFDNAELSGQPLNNNYVVPAASATLYAMWVKDEGGSGGGGGGGGGGTTTTPDTKPQQPDVPETPSIVVTPSEGGKVDSKTNDDGSTTYTFVPEEGKEVLYVRVNGIVMKATDAVTVGKDESASLVVIFGEPGEDYTKQYTDVAGLPDYMTNAVNYVVSSGLFQGTTATSFMPQESMTRAMFATVLARLYGADTTGKTSSFADVEQGSWYAGAVAWANEMGFANGVSASEFAPERAMTRQELVTLVYRFAQKAGVDVSAKGDLSAFADAAQVDDWAGQAMNWAVGIGLINGKGESLAPADTITRVEAAIILERMADLLVK